MSRPSGSQRRALALGLLALCVLAVWLIILRPAVHYIAARYRAQSDLVTLTAEARARAAELPGVRKDSLELLSSPAWSHTYSAATYALALAAFEGDIRSAVGTDGVELTKPSLAGGLTEMHARASATVSADKLADIVDSLGANPRIAIGRLHIISPLVQDEGRNAPLQLTLELSGDWAPPVLRETP